MRSLRLFKLCSAVSLVLCAAACVLWLRSHFVRDAWAATHPSGSRRVTSNAGRLTFVQTTIENNPVPLTPQPLTWRRSPPQGGPSRLPMQWAWDAFRFSWNTRRQDAIASNGPVRTTTRELSIPHWVPAFLAGLMPVVWLRRTYKDRRLAAFSRRRVCPHCRYDLRASPDRCPECGTATASTVPG